MTARSEGEASTAKVAIIGSGPSAFYAAEQLLKSADPEVTVDMFERLPTPFGLVRAGVAPDHLKIKTVTRGFAQVAAHPRFTFYGNVEFGKHVDLDDLRRAYDQVLFATGAQSDRKLGIPGEDLAGSLPATEFVAWYNGHPDFREAQFPLDVQSAVIIGAGNVALDVARVLCLDEEELLASDMAEHAVRALAADSIRDIYVLARRGPGQAAFTNPELKELAELADADLIIDPGEVALSAEERADLEASADRAAIKKVDMLQEFAGRTQAGRRRRLHLRFLVSPVELVEGANGSVEAVRIVRNRLERSATGTWNAEATGEFETIPAGLVFRSVGYRGVALPGVPFDERLGVILNSRGRVLEPATHEPVPGMYVTGWIKRGPSGVIGTNKPCAAETVANMLEDLREGRTLGGRSHCGHDFGSLVRARQPEVVSFADWQHLDEVEVERGASAGRPRLKFTSVPEMLACIREERMSA